MTRFVIDGLNELESMNTGKDSFKLDNGPIEGSKCLIMNCDQLKQINIGEASFFYFESFELKNLPSLISIQLEIHTFHKCHRIVFESMNDWMNDEWDLIRLQFITLKLGALRGDYETVESNELIMKSMNGDDWLIRSPFSISIQRRRLEFLGYR